MFRTIIFYKWKVEKISGMSSSALSCLICGGGQDSDRDLYPDIITLAH